MGIKFEVWAEIVEYDEEADDYFHATGGVILDSTYSFEEAKKIRDSIVNRMTIDSVIKNLEVIRDETPCLDSDAKRCGCERFDYVLDLLREIKDNPIKEVSDDR